MSLCELLPFRYCTARDTPTDVVVSLSAYARGPYLSPRRRSSSRAPERFPAAIPAPVARHLHLKHRKSVLRYPHDVILAAPRSCDFRASHFLHARTVASRESPKGEGFTGPRMGPLNPWAGGEAAGEDSAGGFAAARGFRALDAPRVSRAAISVDCAANGAAISAASFFWIFPVGCDEIARLSASGRRLRRSSRLLKKRPRRWFLCLSCNSFGPRGYFGGLGCGARIGRAGLCSPMSTLRRGPAKHPLRAMARLTNNRLAELDAEVFRRLQGGRASVRPPGALAAGHAVAAFLFDLLLVAIGPNAGVRPAVSLVRRVDHRREGFRTPRPSPRCGTVCSRTRSRKSFCPGFSAFRR